MVHTTRVSFAAVTPAKGPAADRLPVHQVAQGFQFTGSRTWNRAKRRGNTVELTVHASASALALGMTFGQTLGLGVAR
jgi:hypothetical protein